MSRPGLHLHVGPGVSDHLSGGGEVPAVEAGVQLVQAGSGGRVPHGRGSVHEAFVGDVSLLQPPVHVFFENLPVHRV